MRDSVADMTPFYLLDDIVWVNDSIYYLWIIVR